MQYFVIFCQSVVSVQFLNSNDIVTYIFWDRFCGLVVRVPNCRSRGRGSIPSTTRFLRISGSGTGPTQPREYNWRATWKKNIGFGLERREYGHRVPSRWPRGTPYPQKLTLTSPTSGFRSRTQATEFFNLNFCFLWNKEFFSPKSNIRWQRGLLY
jgi:hypothetical protein